MWQFVEQTDGNRAQLVATLDKKRKQQPSSTGSSTVSLATGPKSAKPNEWVVVPVFVDIVKLALKSREDCCVRLPNGHINMSAFDRLAAVVGAFTRHMSQVNQTLPDVGAYGHLCHHMQSCRLLNETVEDTCIENCGI
ncbi:hypothetical protein pipiens_012386 [Culex pipiens pipiens]|uniref:Uncharacterized protein n=1 Tax=Culex pipiens pipiens TaxID=38569 RepID=A0ABD1D337_CULPP